jgi:hypothetical protein
MQRVFTRDEVLLWLNDRLGRHFHVSFGIKCNDGTYVMLSVEGNLAHWSEDPEADGLTPDHRDELIGLYDVGDNMLNLSDLPDDLPGSVEHEGFSLKLCPVNDERDGVWLWLVDTKEADDA